MQAQNFLVAISLVYSLEPLRDGTFAKTEGLGGYGSFSSLVVETQKFVSGDIITNRLI